AAAAVAAARAAAAVPAPRRAAAVVVVAHEAAVLVALLHLGGALPAARAALVPAEVLVAAAAAAVAPAAAVVVVVVAAAPAAAAVPAPRRAVAAAGGPAAAVVVAGEAAVLVAVLHLGGTLPAARAALVAAASVVVPIVIIARHGAHPFVRRTRQRPFPLHHGAPGALNSPAVLFQRHLGLAGLKEAAQLLVGGLFLAQDLAERLRVVVLPQRLGQADCRPVRENLEVLGLPSDHRERRVLRCLVPRRRDRALTVLDQPFRRLALAAARRLPRVLQDLLDLRVLFLGLRLVGLEELLETLVGRRLGELRQRLRQLLLGAGQITDVSVVHVLERTQFHGFNSSCVCGLFSRRTHIQPRRYEAIVNRQ